MDIVNEKTTYVVTASFTDENGDAVTPSSGQYRIDDVDSDTEITGWTVFAPTSATHDIEITPYENVMIDSDNQSERRCLTVEFTYGLGKVGIAEHYYTLRNLVKVT